MRRPPARPTPALVTRPANASVTPNARTMGQAVDAGISITLSAVPVDLFCISSIAPSPSYEVHNRKHCNPHCIHEMPIEGEDCEPFTMPLVDTSGHRERQHGREHRQSNHDMGCVESNQRIEGRPEQVGADGQPIPVDQPVPLPGGTHDEDHAQRDRGRQPCGECLDAVQSDGDYGQPYGEAAGKQTYSSGYGNLQHLPRRRPAQAFPDVENVSNDKYGEDRRLAGNERHHGNSSSGREIPFDVLWRQDRWSDTHASYSQSGSSGGFRSHNGRRLWPTGASSKLYGGGGEVVSHSSVHASHGSLPASSPRK